MIGNRVSHSKKKTKRYFSVNISKKRFLLTSENRWITLKVSASGIKTINKMGIEKALSLIPKGKNKGLLKRGYKKT
jgi:large subunit ribosomal protein L28